ncbi:HTH domain-containing protein [Natronorubrum bangense]
MSHHTTPKTVELWIRSFTPMSAGPTQEQALERLDDLEASAPIESVEVGVWGKVVGQTADTTRIPQLQRIETRLEAFESWAAQTSRSLEPFFRETHIECSITDEQYDVWRLPTVALAEFSGDDELLHVAPCRDGETTIDVGDRIDALVDEETDPSVPIDDEQQPNEVIIDRLDDQTTSYSSAHLQSPSSRSD